ncbi:MAG: dihydrolipoyl dehydrogenase [Planctomycetes bacterium]|nr:dihydrolipoyl dehydrogenase [Planctomycetota bacterium]
MTKGTQQLGEFDVVVIGGGPGGYVAAIKAGQLGMRTALVEKDPQPGGTCLHRGCIPTKALLQTAHVLDLANEGSKYGVEIGEARLDLAAAMKFKGRVVKKNAGGVEYLLKKNKVTTIHGKGSLSSSTRVAIELSDGGRGELSGKNIVLATGSVAARPGFLDFGSDRIITSDEALQLESLPKHITVLGAGAVGTEFASIFRSFGVEVVLVEMLPRLLPLEDHDCSDELLKALKKRKIDCRVSTKLEKATPSAKHVTIELSSADGKKETFDTDILLCAIGRWPFTDGLGLEKVGVEVEKGFVVTDADQRTSVPNIYAIGDIVGNTPLLAHAASAEALVAVEIIAGKNPPRIDPLRIPSATYCHPEVASVGLSEQKAKELGHKVKAFKFPITALGKAGIVGATHGFFKLVADDQFGEILGVHIIGEHATDLIAEGCALLGLESTASDLAHIVHPHPTLSEGLLEAAHGLTGGAIHI